VSDRKIDEAGGFDFTDEERHQVILQELDGMIESTMEFIADDDVTPWEDPEGRTMDLACLMHVKKLYQDFNGLED
jgi:hypothetical protein